LLTLLVFPVEINRYLPAIISAQETGENSGTKEEVVCLYCYINVGTALARPRACREDAECPKADGLKLSLRARRTGKGVDIATHVVLKEIKEIK
jgi:hypothetical protein